MNFQQLRAFRELTRRGFSLTETALASGTTQPGLTRQIRDLESEFGFAVFERQGNRIVGLSAPGRTMLAIVERLLAEAERLLGVRGAYENAHSGTLVIATTHTQARYVLPEAVVGFRRAFPQVRIEMRQCASEQVARLVMSGAADIGIAGDVLGARPELATFACYDWRYHALVPDGHPLLDLPQPALRDLAAHPILTYDRGMAGRRQLDDAFAAAGLQPDIVLTSMDSDVIKQYVALGFGVGLLTPIAVRPNEDTGLRILDTGRLFAPSTTLLALRRGAYVRSYVYDFVARLLPQLPRGEIDREVGVVQPGASSRRVTAANDLLRNVVPDSRPFGAARAGRQDAHARI
jgi:LysR family transcriptional regulator, cys regulon transcriptional activator